MDVNAFANGPPSDVRMSHQSQRATTARALPESLVPESLVGRIRGSLLGLFRPGALQQSVATSDRVPYCSLSDLCEVVLLSRPRQETKLLLLAPLYCPGSRRRRNSNSVLLRLHNHRLYEFAHDLIVQIRYLCLEV